jgi:PAS domain S-box-containing protein
MHSETNCGTAIRSRKEGDLAGRVMSFSPVAITTTNREGKITYANAQAKRLLGLGEDLTTSRSSNGPGWRFTDFAGRSLPDAELPFRRVLQTALPAEDVRLALEWPDGQRKLLSITATPLPDESGRVNHVVTVMQEIPERVQSEIAVRQSEELCRQVFEAVNDAVFLRRLTPEGFAGSYAEVNDVACKWLGYSREELLQKYPTDIDPEVTPEQLAARAKQLLTQAAVVFQTRLLTKAGHRIPVEISSHLFEWQGQPMILSIARDLTEHNRSAAALRKSEQNFRSIFENAPIGIYQSSVDRLVIANPTLAGMFGYASPEEMLASASTPTSFFVQPDQRRRIVYAAMQSDTFTRQEVEYRRKNGSTFTAHLRMRAVRDEAGETSFLEGFVEDITERKRLENELALREHRLNSFFNNATAGLSIVDRQLRFVQINETLAQFNGLPADQHLGRTIRSVLPKLAPVLEPLLQQVLASSAPILNYHISGETASAPGQIRHWIASYFPLFGEDDRPAAVGSVVVEITEQKRAEEKLRESEEKFRQLAENIDKVFWICDKEKNHVLYVSPAYERIWGHPCQSLYEQPSSFAEAIHPADRDRILASVEREKQGQGYEEEYRIVRPDGSVRWIHDRGFIVRNERGEFYRLAGLAEDITDRRQLEEQLRQAQKMEAIGQLAGGVAHDFNNILAATLMHLGLLQQNPQVTLGTKESLKEVENEIVHAANLTRQLLLFSRRQVARFEPLDLNALIQDLLKMLRRLLGENIEVLFQSSVEAAWVEADAGMMEQVVMNLCINARDAMPKGGRLNLATGVIELGAQSAIRNLDARPGHFVCLTVTDAGCGMDESVLKRIFEPFFTTKGVGQGTGLGLATVYGIVKQHEGWVEVESAPAQGSSFRVYLPATTGPSSASPRREELKGGSETILLVEDELLVRRTAALCLRKLGYAVLEASSGEEAMKLWEQHQQKIELLFSDMVMPGATTGLDLAQRMRTQKAALKVIISSGYSPDLAGSPPVTGQHVTYLAKPYKASALARIVRYCLDQD